MRDKPKGEVSDRVNARQLDDRSAVGVGGAGVRCESSPSHPDQFSVRYCNDHVRCDRRHFLRTKDFLIWLR